VTIIGSTKDVVKQAVVEKQLLTAPFRVRLSFPVCGINQREESMKVIVNQFEQNSFLFVFLMTIKIHNLWFNNLALNVYTYLLKKTTNKGERTMENKNIINRIRNAAGLCLVLVLFTGMANDAFSQEVMVLDLETSMRIALTQSNDIIRQQNSFEQSKLGLEFAKANQRTTTRLSWSLPSYSKSIRPVATPTGDVYTNNQSFSTNASLRITQPVRWTDGTFTFTTNYSANNQYTLEKDGSKRQNHNWTDSFNINYSQPLFQPNEQIFDWDQTQRDFTIAERKYEQTENSIWLNVMRDFYDLYSTKQRLEIAQANYDNTFKNYEMAVNKYNACLLYTSPSPRD